MTEPDHHLQSQPLVTTADGSRTLQSIRYGETYHSVNGAVIESRHVYLVASGVSARLAAGQHTRVLEIGLGTGLNFLLTADAALSADTTLHYVAAEHALLSSAVMEPLGYRALLEEPRLADAFQTMLQQHEAQQHEAQQRGAQRPMSGGTVNTGARLPEPHLHWSDPDIRLSVLTTDVSTSTLPAPGFHAVYLDAFSPERNPECWTGGFLGSLFDALLPGGCLVTYCAKGRVRRALAQAGFRVERLAGPPGKREMLRATRTPP